MTDMTIEDQQNIAREILVKVKWGIDSEAIIAGGAPRNWDIGQPANDIDLYLRSNCINTASRFKAQIANVIFGCKSGELETYQDVDTGNYKFGIDLEIVYLLGVIYKGVKFQFICLNGNKEYKDFKDDIVGHMDIGLNHIYCDWYCNSDNHLNATKEYNEDFMNKTLSLYVDTMTPSQLQHCMQHHLPKMQSYFPDYKLVVKKG